MSARCFELAELPDMPWKNGAGRTREIACWPPGAGIHEFDWRISVAAMAANGPFSRFDGIDRSIMLLSGDGVLLDDGVAPHRLDRPLAPFAFAGEAPLHATLLGGISQNFNVMTRRGRCRARIGLLRGPEQLAVLPDSAALLLAIRGGWRCAPVDQATLALADGAGAWWPPGEAPGRIQVTPLACEHPGFLLATWIECERMGVAAHFPRVQASA